MNGARVQRTAVATILVALLLGTADAGAATRSVAAAADRSGPTDTVVVTGVTAADVGALRRLAGPRADVRLIPEIDTAAIEVPASLAGAVIAEIDASGPASADASRDVIWRAQGLTPNDPDWAAWQASFAEVDLPDAWSTTTGSPSVVIAIVDSGVENLPELAGRITAGWDYVDGDADPSNDDFGHGTSAALIAAAAGNNNNLGVGTCWGCRIMPLRVLGNDGRGSSLDIAAAIVAAADQGANVINLSLGGDTRSPSVAAAVRYASLRGAVVVAAAGNGGGTATESSPVYPANEPGVVSVAGSVSPTALHPWSQRGSWIDLAAPGCNYSWGWAPVPGATPPLDDGDDYAFCGTSAAAPMVSGLAGLLKSARPDASRTMLSNALLDSPRPIWIGPDRPAVALDADAAMASVLTNGERPELDRNPLDVAGPSVSLGLAEGTYGGTLTFSSTATDPSGIASWELTVDGRAVANPVVAGATGAFTFNTATEPDGPHQLQVRVVDGVGNSAVSAPVTVTIDNTRPAMLLLAPTSGRAGRSIPVAVGVNDAGQVRVTFLALGNQVVGGFVGTGARTFPVRLPSSGTHRLVAASIDVAGNLSFSNMVYVRVRRR